MLARKCESFDDPHMYTFDGGFIEYHATCEFVYTQPCSGAGIPEDIPFFQVYGQHDKAFASPRTSGSLVGSHPTSTKIVGLRMNNLDFKLERVGNAIQASV